MTGLRFERQKLMAPQVPGPGYSYVGQLQDQTRQRFYDILAELDPYRATPKEFVNLLVNAAMRDEEIGKSIYRMNEDRLRNPESWRPLKPAGFRSPQPSPQPIPAQPTPASMTASPVSSAPQTTLPSQAPMHKPPYNTPQSMAFQVPTPHDEHMPMVPMVPSVQPLSGDAVSNQPLDNTVETDDEPSEPKEQGCDYNWVLERAAWHLGWTGSFDSLPDVQQANVGYSAAFKLLNLLQKTHDLMDKHVTFADRVHILTIMRDVMAATLETNSRVGASCREHAHSYDDNFVGAVNKLTESQKKRLKVLADGKWLHELQGLVEAAERQNMFPRLSEALVTIDC
ncbi:hypothetical protein F4780DRAFT_651190 [Xylariomycetidae sp. FL0641]|nr:hypothetical protein F4780DRAFT_651190 [Xylariomycetidae sp. FL0641]